MLEPVAGEFCDEMLVVATPVAKKLQEPAPKPQEPAPKPQKPAPKPQEPAPKPQEPATKPQEAASKPQEPATKPQEPATKPQEPATKPQEPAPKPQEPAPPKTSNPVKKHVIIEKKKITPILINKQNEERRGPYLTPYTLLNGEDRWQVAFPRKTRMDNVKKVVRSIYVPEEGKAPHKQLPLLRWMARQMEKYAFLSNVKPEFYQHLVDNMLAAIKATFDLTPELAKIRNEHGIPSKEKLEEMLKVKGPTEQFAEEEDLMAEGAPEVKLITDDRFCRRIFALQPKLDVPSLPAPKTTKPIQRSSSIRKVVLGRYNYWADAEETTMTVSIQPCQLKKPQ